MATCTRVESGMMPDGKTRYVWYEYDDGSVVFRVGGSRSWRNNNPGNVMDGPGRLRKDYGGLAIFPDLSTGAKAKRILFAPGGKYYGYESARQVFKGKFNEKGEQIPGTGYAPRFDESGKVINNPDAYADFVRQYFREYYKAKYNRDLDIERTKIRDYTPEMLDVLEKAIDANEEFGEGKVFRYDPTGRLVGYPGGGSPPDNVTASSRQSVRTSPHVPGSLALDLAARPNRFGPIDPSIWGQSIPSVGPNLLTGEPPIRGLPTSADLPFHYSSSGAEWPTPTEQEGFGGTSYLTLHPAPFLRRNKLLEPIRFDGPFSKGQGSTGQAGQPGLTPASPLGPWPGPYPWARRNPLLYPDLG